MIFQIAKKSELLTKNEEKVFIRTVDFLEKLWIELRGETGSEDKTENNKAVEISEKDTYEQTKNCFYSGGRQPGNSDRIYLSDASELFLILWKQPLVTVRKW